MIKRLCLVLFVAFLACNLGSVLGAGPQVIIRRPSAVVSSANPLAANRQPGGDTSLPNIYWATAGVEGGIPSAGWAQSGSTIVGTGSTTTAATINTALSSCGTNQYVLLSGTFVLSTGITFRNSNCELRGAGAGATTKITFTGDVGTCGWFYGEGIAMCSATAGYYCSSNCGTGGPAHTATWSAGYAQGTSVITLSSTTGLVVDMSLLLDQVDDSTDGWPAAGDIFATSLGGVSGTTDSGGNGSSRPGRSHSELHRVTAINGSNVTISPPILSPDYRAGQTPGAAWLDSAAMIHDSGINNLTIDFNAIAAGFSEIGIFINNARNVWVINCRLIVTDGTGSIWHISALDTLHATFSGNYFYGPDSNLNQRYSMEVKTTSQILVQDNIFHSNVSPIIENDPDVGSVYAYNYNNTDHYSAAIQEHNPGMYYGLYEGNDMSHFFGDNIHGTHHFSTLIRNLFDMTQSTNCADDCSAIAFGSRNRFGQALGNVLANHALYNRDQLSDNPANTDAMFHTGFDGNNLDFQPGVDANVKRTLFRWGNYDTITGNVRWCGNSSNTGWVARCGSVTEVPSSITSFSNAIPATETVPNSLYLSAKPSWWGATAWPPIGPEISGGNIGPGSYGGHANKIPARIRFEAGTNDPAYGSSSPRILLGVTP